jgi:hypothetical protein
VKNLFFCLFFFVGLLYSGDSEGNNKLNIDPFDFYSGIENQAVDKQEVVSDVLTINDAQQKEKTIRFCTPFVDESGRNLIKCDLMRVESSEILDIDSEKYRSILQVQDDISESRSVGSVVGYGCKLVLEKFIVDGIVKFVEVLVCIGQDAASGDPHGAPYNPHKPPKPSYPDYPHHHNPMDPARSSTEIR